MNETGPHASRPGPRLTANDGHGGSPARRGRVVVGVLLTAVLLTLGAVTVRATRWWGCTFTPRDQAAALTAYEEDPAFSVAPPDGRLVTEASRTRACDHRRGSWEREEQAGPELATAWRRYTVDRTYPLDDLTALVKPQADAAGWQLVLQQGDAGGAFLRYCRTIGGTPAWLEVSSTADGTFTVLIDGRPDRSGC